MTAETDPEIIREMIKMNRQQINMKITSINKSIKEYTYAGYSDRSDIMQEIRAKNDDYVKLRMRYLELNDQLHEARKDGR